MKQIDYLKLVATGKKAVHYAHPSEADESLTGFVGFGLIVSLGLTFAIAIGASYAGDAVTQESVGWGLAGTLLPGILLIAIGMVISGSPRAVRLIMAAIALGSLFLIAAAIIAGPMNAGYLLIPACVYLLLVAAGALRQLGN